MVGRSLTERFPYENNTQDELILEAYNLTTDLVEGCSFELYKGEILGLAGLMGSGALNCRGLSMVSIRSARVRCDLKARSLISAHLVLCKSRAGLRDGGPQT